MIIVDKEQLLSKELGRGVDTYDENSKPCVKCAFLESTSALGNDYHNITDAYWDLIGFYEMNPARHSSYGWRVEHPELCKILDKYESRLIKKNSLDTILPDLVEEIKDLVEFV